MSYLPPLCTSLYTRGLRSSAILHGVGSYLATAILWQIIGPIFEGQAVHKSWTACPLKTALLRCLKMLEIELPLLPTSRNIIEERWAQTHSGGSLKSRMLYSAILQTLDVPAIWVYYITAGVGSSVPSFAINGWWRETCCLRLRYCPRQVLVNSHKLGNYSEVGVIEFLRNYWWCKRSYAASATQRSLRFSFAVYRHRAAAWDMLFCQSAVMSGSSKQSSVTPHC